MTDLLGQEEQARPNYHPPKELGLPRCVGNAEPNDDRTLPPELKPGNLKKPRTTGKQPRPQNLQSQTCGQQALRTHPKSKTQR
ncbi:hypothetical protein [Methylovulum sp.]|uniref:hypothetical protein n=1 Tax=Methylovulum sp. TaxID=1916980 RepID=UPI0026362551|nr:hypothetical protein [Methylovulum sp.]MDD5125017.1 hypothetical protein [Methylovulum sp.]